MTGSVEASVEAVVRALLERAHELEPDQVPHLVAEEAARAGFRDVELLLVDRQQVHLSSLTTNTRYAVDTTLPGDAYRRSRGHIVEEGDAHRVYVTLVDGEDRIGVLTAVVDQASDQVLEDAHVLAAAAAGLVVSKRAYTDGFEIARRLEAMDLAAEFRWSLLPPLTMSTPRVRIAGMLEPAYEIAGDAFDYAVNGDVAHVAMFDAVGHGLRACQLANLADRGVSQLPAFGLRPDRHRDRDRRRAHGRSSARAGSSPRCWPSSTSSTGVSAGSPPGTRRRCSCGAARSWRRSSRRRACPSVSAALRRQVSEVQLEPDDAIFCYSDGVTEARSVDGYFFGEERLADYLARAAADEFAPAETVRRLVLRLYEHNPAPLHDDATMLLVNWRKP